MNNNLRICIIIVMLAVSGFHRAGSAHAVSGPDDFIRRSGTMLTSGGLPFYAVGVNSYYLQHIAAYGDTHHVREVFDEAREMGVTVIRTWGFHDAVDTSDRAAIQQGAGVYNERGLQALDLVLSMARESGIRLILPLVNNWDDYGGMNAYVRWYARMNLSAAQPLSIPPQTLVRGVEGRRYAVNVAGTLSHDDFYRIEQIGAWYREYCRMLIDRINSITGIRYRDDPTIMMWELANEPRSSDPTGELIYEWMLEMSSYIKAIDPDHLLASGEEGHDTRSAPYPGMDTYGDAGWSFDGTAGISYSRNITIPGIDLATAHCYPEAWNLTLIQGSLWSADHQMVARAEGKPFILEEFGSRQYAPQCFEMLFSDALYGNSAGILPWQFIYDGRPDNDGYAFSCTGDDDICGLIARYTRLYREKAAGTLELPRSTLLLNAFPNPFNDYTFIHYTLSDPSRVQLDIYNYLGQRLGGFTDNNQQPGTYFYPFTARMMSSGIYFIVLQTPLYIESRKIILLK